jgi:hypothetical protein
LNCPASSEQFQISVIKDAEHGLHIVGVMKDEAIARSEQFETVRPCMRSNTAHLLFHHMSMNDLQVLFPGRTNLANWSKRKDMRVHLRLNDEIEGWNL